MIRGMDDGVYMVYLFIISFVLIVCVIALFLYLIAIFSVYQVYGGEENKTNMEIAPTLCGASEVIGIHNSCCHIQVYCARFWWPIHCYTHIGAIANQQYCKIGGIL